MNNSWFWRGCRVEIVVVCLAGSNRWQTCEKNRENICDLEYPNVPWPVISPVWEFSVFAIEMRILVCDCECVSAEIAAHNNRFSLSSIGRGLTVVRFVVDSKSLLPLLLKKEWILRKDQKTPSTQGNAQRKCKIPWIIYVRSPSDGRRPPTTRLFAIVLFESAAAVRARISKERTQAKVSPVVVPRGENRI